MTEKQRINYNAMRKALLDISQSDSIDRLRKNEWSLDFEEALEMAYENIRQHAKDYVKGIKHIPAKS